MTRIAVIDIGKTNAKLALVDGGSLTEIDAKTPRAALAAGEIGLTVKTEHLQLRAPIYGAEASLPNPDWLAPRPPKLRVRISPSTASWILTGSRSLCSRARACSWTVRSVRCRNPRSAA